MSKLGLKNIGGFTPHNVAASLRKPDKDTNETNTPVRQEQVRQVHITASTGDLVESVLKVWNFFHNRNQKKRIFREELDQKILQAAYDQKGFLTSQQALASGYCSRAEVQDSLQRLQDRAICYLWESKTEIELFIFPGYIPRSWQCEHCEARTPAPLEFEQGAKGPDCGCCGAPTKVVLHANL